MIKRLRQKFILSAMISMAIVLAIIITAINVTNYRNVIKEADMQLEQLTAQADGDPVMDSNFDFEKADEKRPDKEQDPNLFDSSMEFSPFSNGKPNDFRFYAVTLDSDNNPVAVNTEFTAMVDEDEAISIAQSLAESNTNSGFYEGFRIGVSKNTNDGTTTYIFLNCERELSTFRTFLIASIGISLGGLVVVFLLICFFSKLALRPVAESIAKQKRFITDASHELKTPLTIIDANTEVIEMDKGEDEWTEGIHNQVSRLTELTNKLVFLSRMDEEATTLQRLDFSLSDAISETVEPFTAVANSKGKSLELSVQKGISYNGDESQIRQLVSLLVDNAMKYSKEKGKIRVSLSTERKNKVLTVWNETDTIETGSHDLLFERFYRMDQSRNSKTGGHGIGLSVAKAIVLAHKGKITAKSTDGKSIQFTVTL